MTLGIPAHRINLFHNGVDTEAFQPLKQGKRFRHDINVPAGTILVGFAGRLEYEKGPDLFLRAADRIHAELPHVHFVIVGDGSMMKELKHMRKQMRLEQHIHFANWSTNMAEVYPAFDIMAHTSRSDGTSLVLLEAMSCGKAVVGMGVGGVKEMIENEHTGMLVRRDDWESLAGQIVQLLQQPKLLKSMGAEARKRIQEHFNVVNNAHKTAALLKYIARSACGKLHGKSNGEQFPVMNGKLSLKATAGKQ